MTVVGGTTTRDIDFSLDSGGSIPGFVYQSDGVTPVAGADVSAHSETGGFGHARTSADGGFNVDGLVTGSYRVQANASDQWYVGEFYSGTTGWDQAALVVVTAGQSASATVFTLDLGGSISGTVTKGDGSPVPNADVWADSYVCCRGANGVRTDALGRYTIQGLASDTYRVQAQAPAQGFARQYYSSTPNPESTEGGRRVSVLRRQEGAPVLLG